MIEAVAEHSLRNGEVVVLLGADPSVGGPELMASAETVTDLAMAFIVRHTCGFVTVMLSAERCDELDLPALSTDHPSVLAPAVSVDAADGVLTGISARDRARTAHLLASADTVRADLTRPGHVVPVRWSPDGSSTTGGAALEFCVAAGLAPAVVRCELTRDTDGELMSEPEAFLFAAAHGLAVVRSDQVTQRAA